MRPLKGRRYARLGPCGLMRRACEQDPAPALFAVRSVEGSNQLNTNEPSAAFILLGFLWPNKERGLVSSSLPRFCVGRRIGDIRQDTSLVALPVAAGMSADTSRSGTQIGSRNGRKVQCTAVQSPLADLCYTRQ
jgi:hypothetical protein